MGTKWGFPNNGGNYSPEELRLQQECCRLDSRKNFSWREGQKGLRKQSWRKACKLQTHSCSLGGSKLGSWLGEAQGICVYKEDKLCVCLYNQPLLGV